MAVILSHTERSRRIENFIEQLGGVLELSRAAEDLVEQMAREGNAASSIETAVQSLLTPMATLRTNVAGLLSGLSMTHQHVVSCGMPHNYPFAVVTASDPANAGYGTIRVAPAYSTYVNPFIGFLAGDDVTISRAANSANNATFRLRYTPNQAGGEHIANGGFSSTSNWTEASAGIEVAGGVGGFGMSTNDSLRQVKADMAIPWVDGSVYLLRFRVDSYTSGAINVGTNSTPVQFSANAVGTYEALIVADNHADGLVFTGASAQLAIDDVSMIPWTGLAFSGGIGGDSERDDSLIVTLSER